MKAFWIVTEEERKPGKYYVLIQRLTESDNIAHAAKNAIIANVFLTYKTAKKCAETWINDLKEKGCMIC